MNKWFLRQQRQENYITGAVIREKALQYAISMGLHDFKCSANWIQSFKERHNIKVYRLHGEGQSADLIGASVAKHIFPTMSGSDDPDD